MESGKLSLCATPIGNLEDISLRVLRTLKEADCIAAEDTRNSIKLLNHFEIKTPMTAYHEFNKVEKARELVTRLLKGENIALITDAGTPCISDPGEELVRQAIDAGINVESLPGPAAFVTALTLSALSTRRFVFEAFLPTEKSNKKERKAILESLSTEERTIIREEEPRGEYVLVLAGASREKKLLEEQAKWETLTPEEHFEHYIKEGLNEKDALKQVAKDRGMGKRDVYKMIKG